MKIVYLDTNTVRNYSKKLAEWSKQNHLTTSSLTVFEILSGVEEGNDREFQARRTSLKRLLESNVKIDWNFIMAKELKAFNIIPKDVDGMVVEALAKALVESKDYDEYKEKTITIDGQTFNCSILQDFDSRIVELGRKISDEIKNYSNGIPKYIKNSYKSHLKENILPQLNVLSEIAMIPIIEEVANARRGTTKYFETQKKYDKSLWVYLIYSAWLRLRVEFYGDAIGKHDLFDLFHLIYIKMGDDIVTDDKIFYRINENVDLINVYSANEFSK